MGPTQKEDVVEELTRPVVKLLVTLVGLFVLEFIVLRLPGVGTVIPELGATVGGIAEAVITLAMVAVLVNFGREIEPRLNRILEGPTEVVQDIAESVKYVVYIFAIVLAYRGLWVVVPILRLDSLIYDLAFLLLALVPTAIVAVRIYNNVDDITDVLTQQVKSATVDEVACPSCDEQIRASQEFCPNCGEDVTDVAETEAIPSDCPECDSRVSPDMSFCGNCGSELSTAN